jgi:hypothetical protein
MLASFVKACAAAPSLGLRIYLQGELAPIDSGDRPPDVPKNKPGHAGRFDVFGRELLLTAPESS